MGLLLEDLAAKQAGPHRIVKRVLSSVGRAAPLQGVGREFEPLSTHQFRDLQLSSTV